MSREERGTLVTITATYHSEREKVTRMLNWLPSPRDFKTQLREAQDGSADKRFTRLATLAQSNLDFLQTIQVNRAIDALMSQSGVDFPRHRLAILASTTIDHLVPAIRVACLRRGILLDVYSGGYGQYRQDILDSSSTLHAFAPETILLSIAVTHFVPPIDIATSIEQRDTALRQAIGDLRSLWQRARTSFGCAVIQQNFLDVSEPLFGNFDLLVPGSQYSVVERLNVSLAEQAREEGALILDVARASRRDGIDFWFDKIRMFQAKQEIAPQAAPMYGDLLARVVGAQLGKSKKCLVLDLDNTLWGGVLGDDGLNGLVLGQGSALGEAHVEVQRYAKQLKERGILLAVCSKNELAAAEEAFASLPEMILKRSDIAAFVVNWEDKARNIESIARQLNIGVDSLVFLDDNPVERARVREALPMVAVPELSDDASGYVRRLADAGYFEAISFTVEDSERTDLYKQIAQRDALESSAQSMDEFLQNLQMVMEYGPVTSLELPRVAQLVNKTNQFTPTTRRYSTEAIEKHLKTDGAIGIQVRLKDRFGDNGLVSAIILLPVPGAKSTLEIDSWVMSCRVFGRQLEHEIMNVTVETAKRNGIREIVGSFIPTAKNGVIRELYPGFGFRSVADAALPNGGSRWSLLISEYAPRSTYITKEAKTS